MRSLVLSAALLVALPAGAVNIEYIAVRDPGNPPDTTGICFAPDCGSVPYEYAIAKYEVTNAQYAEFLNHVADPDAYGLYSASMAISYPLAPPGFKRVYIVDPGFENKPVVDVSFWDAVRFEGSAPGPRLNDQSRTGRCGKLAVLPPASGAAVDYEIA
jgi:sulfatase modifying factor 1